MPSNDSPENASDPEILAARGEVELAKAELQSRLHHASDSSKRAFGRMARKARPVLIAAAVVVGVVVLARVVRSATRKRKARRPSESVQSKPTLLRVAVGAALRGAVRALATRVAEQAVQRVASENDQRASAASPWDAPAEAGEGGLGEGSSTAASR